MTLALQQAIQLAKAYACTDCGKCTATCPIPRAGGRFSPRRQVLTANTKSSQAVVASEALFACLSCGLCSTRCPVGVDYPELVRGTRALARREGVEPDCPHGGALLSVMRMQAAGGLQQERLDWLDDELQTEPEAGAVFYWTGCTMYFDALFPELELTTLDGTRAAVRLLNRLGVRPVVSAEERCCGHDLLWNGDREPFEALARHNVALVERSGATTLVVSCAECARTWKRDYEDFFQNKPPRIVHLTEYLAERLDELGLEDGQEEDTNGDGARRVTYQDPCRLGRHLAVYEPPRRLLDALPGSEPVEMRHSGPSATCCAGGTWSNCDRFAKRIQVERLLEARATGAEVLATACPKCRIHLKCAMKDPHLACAIEIEMRDVAELLDEALTRGLQP